jgi:hypothetical protein
MATVMMSARSKHEYRTADSINIADTDMYTEQCSAPIYRRITVLIDMTRATIRKVMSKLRVTTNA